MSNHDLAFDAQDKGEAEWSQYIVELILAHECVEFEVIFSKHCSINQKIDINLSDLH